MQPQTRFIAQALGRDFARRDLDRKDAQDRLEATFTWVLVDDALEAYDAERRLMEAAS